MGASIHIHPANRDGHPTSAAGASPLKAADSAWCCLDPLLACGTPVASCNCYLTSHTLHVTAPLPTQTQNYTFRGCRGWGQHKAGAPAYNAPGPEPFSQPRISHMLTVLLHLVMAKTFSLSVLRQGLTKFPGADPKSFCSPGRPRNCDPLAYP